MYDHHVVAYRRWLGAIVHRLKPIRRIRVYYNSQSYPL